MLNQTQRLYKSKSKSKIFITILCIFGLLFSWSCSCKNRVSDPNETPPNGGLGDQSTNTNYIPKTYTATRSGDTLIIVNSDGNGIQQAAKISFKDAKVTNVTVDVGTTGIAADVFKYESGGLTMTAFDNVTTTRQKVTATFSLAPNDSRDKLNNPTETVDIEVVKSKGAFDKKVSIGTAIKDIFSYSPYEGIMFQFKNEPEADKIVADISISDNVDPNIDKNDFATVKLISSIKKKVTDATSIEFVSDAAGTDTHSFVYKFKFPSGYGDYEQTEDQLQNGIEYTIEIKTKTSDGSKTITFK